MSGRTLVWLRNDLRIADNPALSAALDGGGDVSAVYIHETDQSLRPIGSAARWWLHHSLNAIAADLTRLGIELEVVRGDTASSVTRAAGQRDATRVVWNRRYAPAQRELDANIKSALREKGIEVRSYAGNALVEPFDISTANGRPYSVYSPFWKTLRHRDIARPLPAPEVRTRSRQPQVDAEYEAPQWSRKFARSWTVGEAAAVARLGEFLDEVVADYPDGRDRPALGATSRLSPHLAFGEISPRQVWHAAQAAAQAAPEKAGAIDKFLSELGWREFNYHQLYHREDIATVSMQEKFANMRWRSDPEALDAWRRGQTGIPVIDAGMRELWETGYMHNRVRMLVASLLAKNLLIDWREGEAWFWDCLVDADIANNPGNWQWVAGSGLDAAPYFRIFNPVTQGERFDAGGAYVRRWVPEIASLPDKWLHHPWDAPSDVLAQVGVKLGETYPAPIVDLAETRSRALAAFQAL